MNQQATCPNCGATKPDITVFQPTREEVDAGVTSELDCKNCNHSYEWKVRQWIPR